MSNVTGILSQIESSGSSAAEQLLPLVYDELRQLAATILASEKPGQTLQATALVHEAWLRLAGHPSAGNSGIETVEGSEEVLVPIPSSQPPASAWKSRTHFFAVAAEAMRRILVDQARRKATVKHGGQLARQELIESDLATTAPSQEVLAVHEALDGLAAADPLAAEVVKIHYFGGFSITEAAELLGMSRASAYRLWTFGRAWLRAALRDKAET